MRIAVPYEDGQVFQHFGHTAQFKLYDAEGKQVTHSQVAGTGASGHGALAALLAAWQVDTLICGGIGMGAQNALKQVGIQIYGGVSGSADEAVQALIQDSLAYDPNARCDHHGEEHHDHACGEHGCGGNHCGSH